MPTKAKLLNLSTGLDCVFFPLPPDGAKRVSSEAGRGAQSQTES